jgi:hypothetical protein
VQKRIERGPASRESGGKSRASDALDEARTVLTGTGEPLDAPLRIPMEERFGHDFSRVRIHTDQRAQESALGLGARGYSAGQDIVLRSAEYDPHTPRGSQVLAHELAHVVQSDRSGRGADFSRIVPFDHPSEVEARAASTLPTALPLQAAPSGLSLDGEGPMEMPPDTITGKDPNVVRPPGGTIKGGEKPDEETQKVMAAVAAARTRAMGYLNGTKSEIIMAVEAFKGHSNGQVNALDGDPSDIHSILPALLGAIGGVVTVAFPPAGAIVIGTTLAASLANTTIQTAVKTEGATVKQGLLNSMEAFARAVSNAHSVALADASNQVSNALTNLAVSDTNVWNQLAIGGDRQLDWVISQLGIVDPAKVSPYGKVLNALMVPFAAWVEKEKFQMGMTKHDKMVSESLPGEQSFKDMHKNMKAGEQSAAELAKKMADEHAKAPAQ